MKRMTVLFSLVFLCALAETSPAKTVSESGIDIQVR